MYSGNAIQNSRTGGYMVVLIRIRYLFRKLTPVMGKSWAMSFIGTGTPLLRETAALASFSVMVLESSTQDIHFN